MSEDLKIKVSYEVDDSNLQKSLAKVQGSTSKALSGGSNGSSTPQTAIDRSLIQANKLQDRMKLLGEAHSRLASQPGMERSLSKVNTEMAGIFAQQKRISTNAGEYLSALNKQVELQKQARNLMNNSDGGSNQFSAHSQRQMAMLQQISGQVPGGGLINKFVSGAGSAEGGMSGLAGGGMAAAAGAAALAVGAVVNEIGKLAARAQELSQSASSASSSLGQLRSANERASIAKDAAASTPGVTSLAGIQAYVSKQGNDFLSNLLNSQGQISSGVKEKIAGGLGGQAGEDWRRIKENRVDMEQDIATAHMNLNRSIYTQDRDYDLSKRKFQVDTQNQIADLNKSAQRQQQDFQINLAQFQENFSGKMAAKEFQQSQQFAQASFQRQQGYAVADYNRGRSDKIQDYTVSANDKAFDLSRSLSRNQEQFNLNKSYQGQDRQENLMRMAISGASGTDYLFSSMDFRKQQAREQQQFDLAKRYQVEDYSTGQGRDLRNLNIGLGRDQRNLNIGLARNATEFGASQQEAQAGRQLQIESELNSRKWQSLQLEIGHARALQDINTAASRLSQSIAFSQEGFANQASDMKYSQGMATYQQNLSDYRQRRGQNYSESDYAGAMRATDPLGALGQSLKDQSFGQALARNAAATGQTPLADQVKDALGFGGIANRKGIAGIGDNLGGFAGWSARNILQGIGILPPGLGAGDNHPGLRQLGSSQPMQVTFNAGNASFPAAPGASQSDLTALDAKWQDIQAKGQNEMMDFMRRLYGG